MNDVIDNEELVYAQFVESTARACHEANKMYCESIGDTSQVTWDAASEVVKQAAYSGVIFALENPDVTPEQMHMNWKRDKIKAGWIYGPVKNEVTRTHPCLVNYEDLPEDQRVKDDILIMVVQMSLDAYEKSVLESQSE
jgi:hypothetical protein